jgi:AraC-like DNA-binding protein
MIRISWNELNPVVTHAHFIKCQPGFQWGPRFIYEHQFIYIVKGNGTGKIQDRIYPAAAGDLFYYGPGIGHCFRAADATPFEIIAMHFELIGSLADARKQPLDEKITSTLHDAGLNNLVFIGERGSEELKLSDYIHVNSSSMEDLFTQITVYYKRDNSMTAMINRGLLLHLLELLYKHTHQITVQLSPQLKTLYHMRSRLIELAEQPYSRIWIKQWTGYNEDYLSRNFREQFGIAPHQFHLTQKIEKAKDFLVHSDSSITQISEKLHFNSIHYFCRVFKLHTGQTPSQYQKFKADISI